MMMILALNSIVMRVILKPLNTIVVEYVSYHSSALAREKSTRHMDKLCLCLWYTNQLIYVILRIRLYN